MTRHAAGTIVVVDWRGGALPQEPGQLRPAVVVEDHELFPDDYPSQITDDQLSRLRRRITVAVGFI